MHTQASRKVESKEKRGGSDADSDDSVEGDHVGVDSADELVKSLENGTYVTHAFCTLLLSTVCLVPSKREVCMYVSEFIALFVYVNLLLDACVDICALNHEFQV